MSPHLGPCVGATRTATKSWVEASTAEVGDGLTKSGALASGLMTSISNDIVSIAPGEAVRRNAD